MALPNTTNLNLRQWQDPEAFDEVEVNSNFAKVDAAIATAIVTAGTRPDTGLYPGKQIYETDTKLYYSWDGTVWVPSHGTTGTFANRPASGYVGQRYYDTTNSTWWAWNGTIWTLSGSQFIGARAKQMTTAQSFISGNYDVVTLNGENHDYGNCHDLVTNNSRLLCPVAGLYSTAGQMTWFTNATGIRKSSIELRGAAPRTLALDSRAAFASSTTSNNMDGGDFVAAAGDYIEMTGMQSSGGPLTLDITEGSTWLSLSLKSLL